MPLFPVKIESTPTFVSLVVFLHTVGSFGASQSFTVVVEPLSLFPVGANFSFVVVAFTIGPEAITSSLTVSNFLASLVKVSPCDPVGGCFPVFPEALFQEPSGRF